MGGVYKLHGKGIKRKVINIAIIDSGVDYLHCLTEPLDGAFRSLSDLTLLDTITTQSHMVIC